MRVDIRKAVLGGVVATAVMTLMAMYVAPMMTGMPMDIAAMLAGMLGGSYMLGMLAHIMMGVIVFPLVYVYAVYRQVPGSPVVRGTIFGIGLWAAAVLVVMPMAGAGVLMANIGGMMAVMASLIAHLVYGALLGGIAGGETMAQTA